MAKAPENSLKTTTDGFLHHSDGLIGSGLPTPAAVESQKLPNTEEFDVIIVGAGFAGLIAARELSLRGRKVLIVEAKDRIGGRTFTAQIDNRNYEIGGTWIHWSQPHVWTEVTRYGLSLTETKGATADHLSLLLDNGTKLKEASMADLWPAMAKVMEKYTDIDGVQGRTVMPLPHTPFAANEAVQKYDQLSMKDRLDQVLNALDCNDEIMLMLLSLLSMNMQGDIAEGGFIDHLRWWALGDYDMARMFDKLGRYKIKEGTSALAQAILNDCQNVTLLLSTPIVSIDRASGNSVTIRTQTGQLLMGRAAIVTIPLNALKNIEFCPPLESKRKSAITTGQCRGGTKFWVKLEKPIGDWFGFAPYPSPITMAYTDDQEGSVIVGFGPDGLLDIQNINVIEKELKKLLPDIKVQYVLGHDWRNDPFILGTWSWYKPGQMSSSLVALQTPEPPIFFASGDISNGWRGFIDGALESGLTSVRDVQQYLRKHFVAT
jgi:monoamine oxidase